LHGEHPLGSSQRSEAFTQFPALASEFGFLELAGGLPLALSPLQLAPAVLELSLAQLCFPVEAQASLNEGGPFDLEPFAVPGDLLFATAEGLLLTGPVTLPAAAQPAAQLREALSLVLYLVQFPSGLFAVAVGCFPAGVPLLLELGPLALQLRLFAANVFLCGDEVAPPLLEVGGELLLLLLQGSAALLEPVFFLEQGGLLGSNGRRLNAEGLRFCLARRGLGQQ
jgi:hypothetical protein